MAITSYLEAQYDSRKSFYNMARLEDDGVALRLYSYSSHVATFHKATNQLALLPRWDHSATTLRHVKEFIQQVGLKSGSKSELEKLYAS